MSIKQNLASAGAVIATFLPVAAAAVHDRQNIARETRFEGRPVIEYSDSRGIVTSSFGKTYDRQPFGIPSTLIIAYDRDKDGKAESGMRIFCVPRRGCLTYELNRQELTEFYEPAFNALRGR